MCRPWASAEAISSSTWRWAARIQHLDGHDAGGTRDRLHHGFRVAPGSRLAHVLDATDPHVNSHHHQAVNVLGEGLEAVASADDGTIEGIECRDRAWCLAVQFQPEDLVGQHAAGRRLFEAFVSACRVRRSE
jgi:putative glutamine amidotransferase